MMTHASVALCIALLASASAVLTDTEKGWTLTHMVDHSSQGISTFGSAMAKCKAAKCQIRNPDFVVRSNLVRHSGPAKAEWEALSNVCEKKQFHKMAETADEEFLSPWFLEKVAKKSLLSSNKKAEDLVDKFIKSEDGMFTIERKNEKPVVVFVYGPSAAGKTFSTEKVLGMLNDKKYGVAKKEAFITIDGGIYRTQSRTYQKLVKFAHDCKYYGWEDQVVSGLGKFKSKLGLAALNFDPRTSKLKSKLKKAIRASKPNMVVPNTLAFDGVIGSYGLDKAREMQKDGYDVVLMLVYADKTACTKQGQERDINEGKKYSNKAWKNSVDNAIYIMNHWSANFMKDGEQMFIVNNNPVMAPDGLRCPSGVLTIEKNEQVELKYVKYNGINLSYDNKPVIKIHKPSSSPSTVGGGQTDGFKGRHWTPLFPKTIPSGCPALQNCGVATSATLSPNADSMEKLGSEEEQDAKEGDVDWTEEEEAGSNTD